MDCPTRGKYTNTYAKIRSVVYIIKYVRWILLLLYIILLIYTECVVDQIYRMMYSRQGHLAICMWIHMHGYTTVEQRSARLSINGMFFSPTTTYVYSKDNAEKKNKCVLLHASYASNESYNDAFINCFRNRSFDSNWVMPASWQTC